MESALKSNLNNWSDFPTEASQTKALFSNAGTNRDQPKFAANDDWLKGKSTSQRIAKRNASESFIYELFDVKDTESMIIVDLKIGFAMFDANRTRRNSKLVV